MTRFHAQLLMPLANPRLFLLHHHEVKICGFNWIIFTAVGQIILKLTRQLDATAEPALEMYRLHHALYMVYFCTAPLSYCAVSLSLSKYNDSNAQLESISLFVLSQPIKQILKYQFTDTENKIANSQPVLTESFCLVEGDRIQNPGQMSASVQS